MDSSSAAGHFVPPPETREWGQQALACDAWTIQGTLRMRGRRRHPTCPHRKNGQRNEPAQASPGLSKALCACRVRPKRKRLRRPRTTGGITCTPSINVQVVRATPSVPSHRSPSTAICRTESVRAVPSARSRHALRRASSTWRPSAYPTHRAPHSSSRHLPGSGHRGP